jgi:hypothetical protein
MKKQLLDTKIFYIFVLTFGILLAGCGSSPKPSDQPPVSPVSVEVPVFVEQPKAPPRASPAPVEQPEAPPRVAPALDAQSSSWKRSNLTDKFGDPTGEYYYTQIVYGTGSSSSQSSSSQGVGIYYYPKNNILAFAIKTNELFSLPLNMFLFRNEPVTLYLKDSANKTYSFSGFQYEKLVEMMMAIVIYPDNELTSLLKMNGAYRAVIEGNDWKCSFTFNGGLPQ